MLSHPAACTLIRQQAQRAMERLGEFGPFRISGAIEVRVEFTTRGERDIRPGEGVERVNERTWIFRGKDIVEAWLKYGSF
jgi:D-aminopeptidase